MGKNGKFRCILMNMAIILASCTLTSQARDVDAASRIVQLYENAGDHPLSIEQVSELKAASRGRWPRQAEVGPKVVEMFASLIARSTVDDAFQQAVLTDAAFNLAGVELDRYAFVRLNDTVELSHGRSQQFGSVIHLIDGEPTVDGGYELERANVMRNHLSLSPLLRFLRKVKEEKGVPAEYSAERPISISPPRNSALRTELLAQMKADQVARTSSSNQNALMIRADQVSAKLVERVLTQYKGFPPAQDVAIDGVHAFFLLAHHVLDGKALASLLPQAEKLMRSEQLSSQDYALMSDRVAVYQGRPQRYGTQSELRNGVYELSKIEDAKSLNASRADMGLDPLPDF